MVHEFFSKIVRGIEDFALAHSYDVILSPTYDSYSREVTQTKRLINGRVDGLIACISNETTDFSHFREYVDRRIPLVFFDCVVDQIAAPKVVIDDFTAGYNAVKHLINQGCKRVAYIGGPLSVSVNSHRFNGYKKALTEAGIEMSEDLILHCQTDNYEFGLHQIKDLMPIR